MITLQNSGSGFFYVPIVIGEFPDLPFLETVQAVDFGDSSPESIAELFNGCSVACNRNRPVQTRCSQVSWLAQNRYRNRTSAGTKRAYLPGRGVYRSETGRPLMILAQADINTQIYGRALRRQAETLYGADKVFHIFPPNSSRADSAAYFGRLAKQCHLEGDIAEKLALGRGLVAEIGQRARRFSAGDRF